MRAKFIDKEYIDFKSQVHPSDDLRANFRSWEMDHDNEEDAMSLFNILLGRHPNYSINALKKLAYDWVGCEYSKNDESFLEDDE